MRFPTIPTNTRKALRDLAILVVTTALLFVAENVAEFGVPMAVVPVVSAGAMLLYRHVRDLAGKGPAT